MAVQLLQVNFRYTIDRAEFEAMAAAMTDVYAAVPGCLWKIWLINDTRGEAGGIYLFADQPSLQAFLAGPIAAAAASHPSFAGYQAKPFEILDAPSQATRAPLTVSHL